MAGSQPVARLSLPPSGIGKGVLGLKKAPVDGGGAGSTGRNRSGPARGISVTGNRNQRGVTMSRRCVSSARLCVYGTVYDADRRERVEGEKGTGKRGRGLGPRRGRRLDVVAGPVIEYYWC